MDNLKTLRKSIDEIDSEIANLLNKRFDLCHEVAKYKLENDVPILDSNREKTVIDNVTSKVENPKVKFVKAIYETIMDESKKYEEEINK